MLHLTLLFSSRVISFDPPRFQLQMLDVALEKAFCKDVWWAHLFLSKLPHLIRESDNCWADDDDGAKSEWRSSHWRKSLSIESLHSCIQAEISSFKKALNTQKHKFLQVFNVLAWIERAKLNKAFGRDFLPCVTFEGSLRVKFSLRRR